MRQLPKWMRQMACARWEAERQRRGRGSARPPAGASGGAAAPAAAASARRGLKRREDERQGKQRKGEKRRRDAAGGSSTGSGDNEHEGASGEAPETSMKRRAQELGLQRSGRQFKFKRLRRASGHDDDMDARLARAGHAWLVHTSIQHEISGLKRAHVEDKESSRVGKRARGLLSPSLLTRQGDG